MNRCTTPRSTRRVTRDGTHSSSMGRQAGRPTQVASSLSENAASNTPPCPTFPARGEMPWSTALPDSAWVTGKSSAASPAGVQTTGRAPSGGATTVSARSSRVLIDAAIACSAASDGRSALERDVDATALARQPVEQAPAHLDQVIEGSLPGAVEVRGDGRQWGAGRKWQVDGFAQRGRGEGAGDEIGE